MCSQVAAGETLHNISRDVKVHEGVLCEVNQLADCDALEAGQVLGVPLRPYNWQDRWSAGCVDSATMAHGAAQLSPYARWTCFSVPDHPTGDGDAFGYLAGQLLQAAGYPAGNQAGSYVSGGWFNLIDLLLEYNADILPSGKPLPSSPKEMNLSQPWCVCGLGCLAPAVLSRRSQPAARPAVLTVTDCVRCTARAALRCTALRRFVPGQTVRVPYRECWPDVNKTCAAEGDHEFSDVFSDGLDVDFSQPYTWGLDDGFLESGPVAGAQKLAWNAYPLSTMHPQVDQRCAPRPGDKEQPCSNEVGGYECPACSETRGKHWCYKVFLGESFFSISHQYGLDWHDVCSYNGVHNCSCLAALDTYIKIPMVQRVANQTAL